MKENETLPPSLRGIKYVIFPEDRIAQAWDLVMIFVITYYAFIIPYQLGISGGVIAVENTVIFVFSVIVNCIFFADTVLAFVRAYRDKNGRLIYNLSAIRKNYIRSGWFFINLLASFPSSALIKHEGQKLLDENDEDPLDNNRMKVFYILEVLKLLRLLRIRKLLNTSHIIQSFWEKCNVGIALTVKFLLLIIFVSHWFACIWGLTAFIEAGSFGSDLGIKLNWISNWYNGSYVEGGLNPIGWYQSFDRYLLCLFWSIQSITSIGYGNIAPVTVAEYTVANILMLLAGIFWAYIIGNLVDAVGAMGTINREYVTRMDNANDMIRDFSTKELPSNITGSNAVIKTSKRVRRFITNQRDRTTRKYLDEQSAPTLLEKYPTLEILSPELQKMCALHLVQPMIETVPYLSSRYLSPAEQTEIALKTVTLEFSTGEQFKEHADLGRGILIFRTGFGYATRGRRDNTNDAEEHGSSSSFRWRKSRTDLPFDVNEVLVEDEFCSNGGGGDRQFLEYHFIGFTKVLFIPRSVIMEVLDKNESAWKNCGRWRYFMGAFTLNAAKEKAIA